MAAVTFTPAELEHFQDEFSSFDLNGDGTIDVRELEDILRNLNEFKDAAQLKALIAEVHCLPVATAVPFNIAS